MKRNGFGKEAGTLATPFAFHLNLVLRATPCPWPRPRPRADAVPRPPQTPLDPQPTPRRPSRAELLPTESRRLATEPGGRERWGGGIPEAVMFIKLDYSAPYILRLGLVPPSPRHPLTGASALGDDRKTFSERVPVPCAGGEAPGRVAMSEAQTPRPVSPPCDIRELAETLSLSISTVSKVLNDRPHIAPATRQRVLREARRRGYQPNWQARALRQKRSRCIGLLLPSISAPLYSERLKGIYEAARERGYEVIVTASEWDPQVEAQACEYLLGRHVEALVVAGISRPQPDAITRVRQRGVPIVFTGQCSSSAAPDDSWVRCDARGGVRELADHLLHLGHRRLLLLGVWGAQSQQPSPRLEGLHDALEKHGLGAECYQFLPTTQTGVGEGYDATDRFIEQARASQAPLPTAVMASNDVLAMGALAALGERGVDVPRDVSVTGFDDVSFAAYCRPPLTTVSQTHLNMGPKAIELAASMIERPSETRPTGLTLPPRLIIRRSTDSPVSRLVTDQEGSIAELRSEQATATNSRIR